MAIERLEKKLADQEKKLEILTKDKLSLQESL